MPESAISSVNWVQKIILNLKQKVYMYLGPANLM